MSSRYMRSGNVCVCTDDALTGTRARKFNNLAPVSTRLAGVFCLLLSLNASSLFGANISAVWANEGGDKVTRDELRATNHTENLTGKVINRAWDGTTVLLSGARNEVVSFNLVLEAAHASAANVTVSFDTLTGPNGAVIQSTPASGNGVFSWVNRPIELFYTRYLQIKGLSFFGYYKGDELIYPTRFRLPVANANGNGIGGWTDRPDHDKFYPDILVPLELSQNFTIQAGENESIWGDIYIPKTAPGGTYTGNVTVREGSTVSRVVPVQLTVYNFSLPDVPTTKVMTPFTASDVMWRYATGYGGYANPLSTDGQRVRTISDRYYELFHRHKIALLGDNDCPVADNPCAASVPRYTGQLFTAANGYDGPGVGTPVGVYAVGLYENWPWRNGSEAEMWQHTNNWVNWFDANAPGNQTFLYLADEPAYSTAPTLEMWSRWMNENPGPGNRMYSMSTLDMVAASILTPSLDVAASHAQIGSCPLIPICDATAVTQGVANSVKSTPGKQLWGYNDGRPGVGTLDTEDDGTAPRTLPWAQYKKGIDAWYYWQANLSGTGNRFQNAVTWGTQSYYDAYLGMYGSNGTTNGNGLLVYPGTDVMNQSDSYGVDGPFASLRLKEWRRGIQDSDYLALASRINPSAVQNIINSVVPKVLWENPAPEGDPSWFVGGVSWSADPDKWEAARAQLAQIIGGSAQPAATTAAPDVTASPAVTAASPAVSTAPDVTTAPATAAVPAVTTATADATAAPVASTTTTTVAAPDTTTQTATTDPTATVTPDAVTTDAAKPTSTTTDTTTTDSTATSTTDTTKPRSTSD